MRLKDRVAVVTGGGRGIGRAIALAFAREGAHVAVAARTANEVENVVSQIKGLGCKAVGITVDLSQREAIQPLVDKVLSYFPVIDILVNNAGIGSSEDPKAIVEFDDEFWAASLFVNLTVPYLLMKAFLPKMIEQRWGRIINVVSVSGKRGVAYGSAYSASKHGLIGLTKAAALEVATSGVRVNALCPGPTRTSMLLKRLQFDAARRGISVKELEESFNPIRRLLEPEEIAPLAVYLASEESEGMTGQSLSVCGGSLMY